MKEYTVNAENEGQRLDKYIHRILGETSMSFIYKMLRKKNFVLNDKKADGKELLNKGDVVKLYLSDETFDKFRTKENINKNTDINKSAFDFKGSIIYEDKDIILINKPHGILSQKANVTDISVNEYLLDYLENTGQIDSSSIIEYKPSVINRLDRNTSGIIIAAKTLKAARILSEGLKNRTINKYYKCLTIGKCDLNGDFSAYITKNNSNNTVKITDSPVNSLSDYIETGYKVISSNDELSLVEVHLITGKSHQIRAHLSYLGYPILGDPKYGIKNLNNKFKCNKQCLHAYRVTFPEYSKEYGFGFSGKTYFCEPEFLRKYKL